MSYRQREIVKVIKLPVTLPGQEVEPHPFLIISCRAAYVNEKHGNYYTGLMLTHSTDYDKFSFKITKPLCEGDPKGVSQVRLHIISGFKLDNIKGIITRIDISAFKEIIRRMQELNFQVDYKD